jgi:hypothetical protein
MKDEANQTTDRISTILDEYLRNITLHLLEQKFIWALLLLDS